MSAARAVAGGTGTPPLRVLHVCATAQVGGGPEHLRLLAEQSAPEVRAYAAVPPGAGYAERLARACPLVPTPLSGPDPRGLPGLVRAIRRLGIDLVHAHGRGASLHARPAAALTGRPLVYTMNGFHVEPGGGRLRDRLYIAGERALRRWVSRYIAVGRSEAALLIRHRVATPERIELVPNGIDPAYLDAPAPAAPEPDAPLRLLSVARPHYQKGLDRIPAVVRALGERGVAFRWSVLGVPPEERSTEDPRVAWEGVRPIGPTTYAGAHALVSLSRWEGLPLAVLEAASVGLPVLASRSAGNDEALDALGAGEWSLPWTRIPEALERLRDPPLWSAVSGRLRKEAPRVCDGRAMARRTVAVYRRVLGARRAEDAR